MAQPHISLAAEKIGSLGGFPITNSILMTWCVMGLLTILAYTATRKAALVPGKLQSVAEIVVEGLHNLFTSVVGETQVGMFFPLLATIFIFVAVNNWGGLIPGVGSIGFKKTEIMGNGETGTPVSPVEAKPAQVQEEKFVPLLRGATADLNTTLALAIIAVAAVQYFGVRTLGLAYFKKFFNTSSPIMFGVGLLEIISEFSRIISFAFRLFGNIFAGEVLLTVIAFLMPLFAPLPFLGLELFVGFIQALVFSMLTAVFLNMATVAHEHV